MAAPLWRPLRQTSHHVEVKEVCADEELVRQLAKDKGVIGRNRAEQGHWQDGAHLRLNESFTR